MWHRCVQVANLVHDVGLAPGESAPLSRAAVILQWEHQQARLQRRQSNSVRRSSSGSAATFRRQSSSIGRQGSVQQMTGRQGSVNQIPSGGRQGSVNQLGRQGSVSRTSASHKKIELPSFERRNMSSRLTVTDILSHEFDLDSFLSGLMAGARTSCIVHFKCSSPISIVSISIVDRHPC
jgi:hypothetical protein